MQTHDTERPASAGPELGQMVEAAGMANWLNHGAASHVSSEGCNGVAQDHLERFAELVRADERERCAKRCELAAKLKADEYQQTGSEEALHEATALVSMAHAFRAELQPLP